MPLPPRPPPDELSLPPEDWFRTVAQRAISAAVAVQEEPLSPPLFSAIQPPQKTQDALAASLNNPSLERLALK
ncbi:hypothetical protein ACFWC9_13415 [Streptomyces goshikiensis]|uniref:hypothetical protein n=1 Tax=Streptomyces goshikiensis TaxID=1942 RepID=UPI0036B163B2